ncbi:MAG: hypothetical protein AAFQ20_13405 [Bacteroidota bacterium]
MKKKEAIQRLGWRFGNHKTFNVNQKDLDAWNTIIDYVNAQDETVINNNYLFAKLYMHEYRQQLERYGTDIYNDSIPQKEIHRFLERPMEFHYQRLTDYVNTSIANKVTEESQSLEKFREAWNGLSVEEVKLNINQMITECIRKFSSK